MPTRRSALALACLAAVAACAPEAKLAPLPAVADRPYRLGVGDTVRVVTFGDEHLTGQFSVNDAGRIAVPVIGNVQAAGLTTTGLGDAIAHALQEQNLMKQPSISVEVVAYRPIFVLGEVTKPGQYPYQPGMTLLTAVAVAGGFTYRAVQRDASVVRQENGKPQEGLVGRQSLLQPGDVVTIFERWF